MMEDGLSIPCYFLACGSFIIGFLLCLIMTRPDSGYRPIGNHADDADFSSYPEQVDKGTPLTEAWQPAHDAVGADSSKPPRKNPSKRLNVKSGAPRRRKGGGSRRKKA